MAFSSVTTTPLLFATLLLLLISTSLTLPSPLIGELSQPLPPDFNATVASNCTRDPALRYCNATGELNNIYKYTIVARYLCNQSLNEDCSLNFTRIDLHGLPKLAPLYLSFEFFWKFCPWSIQSIDLSNNSLTGDFPSHVLLCTQIQKLDLSHNALTGVLPIDRFTSLTNLSSLNLSYNMFSEGGILGVPYFDRFNSSSFYRSGLFPDDHHPRVKILMAILMLVGVLVSVLSLVSCFVSRFWRESYRVTPAWLEMATDGFSEDNLVWKGGKMEIYRGVLRDGEEVEINLQWGRFSVESRKNFEEECCIFVQLEHKNLARVVHWCDRNSIRALVIESNWVCSAKEWLLESPPWKQRLEVLAGVVEGMIYLQDQCLSIGYDLRTSNVMLNANAEPIIARFKIGDHNTESKKIYSLGMLILELVTNKCQDEVIEEGEPELVKWVEAHCPGHSRKVMDEKMKLTATTYEQVKHAIELGLACTDMEADPPLTIDQLPVMFHKVIAPKNQNITSQGSLKERRHEKGSHTFKANATHRY